MVYQFTTVMSPSSNHRSPDILTASTQSKDPLKTCTYAAQGHSHTPYSGSHEKSADEQVDWDDDPDNARNWSSQKKWTATSIVGA